MLNALRLVIFNSVEKMKNRLLIVSILCSIVIAGYGQELTSEDYLVNGFGQKISGDDFKYHSSIQGVEDALIIRATNGNYSMQWQTAAAPKTVDTKYVTYIWLAGIGSSPGRAEMTLKTGNGLTFTFNTDGQKNWLVQSNQGAELFFRSDMEDSFGDKFGFMFLRVPANQVEKGKPLQLTMTGGNDNKTSWYMTFKTAIESGLTIKPFPAIFREHGIKKQLASGTLLYFGLPAEISVYVDGKLNQKKTVGFGSNYFRIGLPEVQRKTIRKIKVESPNLRQEFQLEQLPVKQWEVNFVQHSHTDIGYTRSQTEILAEHLRYIDYALDYCDATDNYPDDAKFRWTCEAAWAVDEFLKCRPDQQVERLIRRIKEGRIEVTAMYFNYDELPDEQSLAASLQPLKRFRALDIAPKTAMQNDVNGIAWCLNDYYHDLGVKYLNMGTHGHRALICFDKPTLFWWESPSGKRMLAYRAEHYMTGNTVFEIDKGNLPNFEGRLLNYLTTLGEKGYPYNLISIQHSGYLTDNSPPSTIASDLIRQWNESFEWPKLRTATATSFFETLESKYASQFPVYRGAWPDWWTDGFGASAREVAAFRKAQSDITAFSGGLAMADIAGIPLPDNIHDRISLTYEALNFYAEHTTGYSESVREPYHEQTMEQRAIKESYAWESHRRAKMVGEEVMGLLQSTLNKEEKPSLVVYNTLNWKRDGLVTVYIDHQLVPRGMQPRITDTEGNNYPAQPMSQRSDGTYWSIWLKDIPAYGYKKLCFEPVLYESETVIKKPELQYETPWYSLKIDANRAAIVSMFDKAMQTELIDPKAPHQLGEFIYERLGNRYQMEQKRLDDFQRFPFDKAWFDSYTSGPIWNTIRMKGATSAACKNYDVQIDIRLYHATKRIDINYSIVKEPIVDAEGIYIAFPFGMEDGKLAFDVQGGVVDAGVDQIPGSSNDWNTVQNYATLKNGNKQIVVTSPDAPLMQFGGINTGRYKAGATPTSTHFYSWPMNNYWVTNFNPDQKGEHRWSFYITSEKNNSNNEAVRFGWGNRIPFLTRILPGGGKGDNIKARSFITGWPENILLVNSTPGSQPNSVILQLRETSGKPADLSQIAPTDKPTSLLQPVNVLGEKIQDGKLQLAPYGSGFYQLSWD